LRWAKASRNRDTAMAHGAAGCQNSHRRSDLAAGGWFLHPLSRDLCQPVLGTHHEEDDQDRSPCVLSHLWRRLELITVVCSSGLLLNHFRTHLFVSNVA